MNFVKGLPLSLNENDILCITIIVIVNCLFKQTHAISWFKTTVKNTVMTFYYQIFSQHKLSFSIIFDWGTQFVNYFWQALCEILEIKTQLFTVYYSQIDEQTEYINFTIQIYLQMYVDYMQNDWVRWCSSAEFTYNNHISEVIKCTLFFVNSEQHSHMNTESFVINITLREHD